MPLGMRVAMRLDPGVPLAQPHPLFASFLIDLDCPSLISIHSNPTKSNEIVRIGAKRYESVRSEMNRGKSYFAVYFFLLNPIRKFIFTLWAAKTSWNFLSAYLRFFLLKFEIFWG